jgi:hypothetical protein
MRTDFVGGNVEHLKLGPARGVGAEADKVKTVSGLYCHVTELAPSSVV